VNDAGVAQHALAREAGLDGNPLRGGVAGGRAKFEPFEPLPVGVRQRQPPLSQLIGATQLDIRDVGIGKRSQHDPRGGERQFWECVGHSQEA
jgi:hypothetical protein